tara:strand:+ start:343 stop:783 length:441 start_codon:yes stop_codon:yes gene_type:complete
MNIRRLVVILLTISLFLSGCIFEDKDNQFTAIDSQSPITDNDNDDLADIMMEYGNISWSELKIVMDESDSDLKTCNPSSQDIVSDCTYDEDDDPYWTEGETLTIRENGKGLCNAGDNGGCKMVFQIKTVSSDGEEKLLQEVKVTVE